MCDPQLVKYFWIEGRVGRQPKAFRIWRVGWLKNQLFLQRAPWRLLWDFSKVLSFILVQVIYPVNSSADRKSINLTACLERFRLFCWNLGRVRYLSWESHYFNTLVGIFTGLCFQCQTVIGLLWGEMISSRRVKRLVGRETESWREISSFSRQKPGKLNSQDFRDFDALCVCECRH